jgi:peptidoglycan/xylan/chitin deacetylase (PgdA/CDA1 family)
MVFPALSSVGGAAGYELIADWARAGHYVGNHTSKHRSLNSKKVSLEDFIRDVEEADAAFSRLDNWLPILRFPYLKEGNTVEKRDGVRAWLAKNNYRSAPVSIDTSDWYYNEIWVSMGEPDRAADRAKLKEMYINHLVDRAAYYDKLAIQVTGRSPAHVMLLHVNSINAELIGEAVQALRAKGWRVVSPKEAFEDPIYQSLPDVLPAGESIVWGLAKARSWSGLRYPAEDSVYEIPALRAAGLLPNAQ